MDNSSTDVRKLRLTSCLLDEDLDLKSHAVELKGGKQVHFFLRPLLDSERTSARQKALTGQSIITYEQSPEALAAYAKDKQKTVAELTVAELNEAARRYGKQGIQANLDVETYNAYMVFFALGGGKTLGTGELGTGREGWDLTDKAGNSVPVTYDVIRTRLHPGLVDDLATLASKSSSLTEVEVKNS
jgi:hypothetical protein